MQSILSAMLTIKARFEDQQQKERGATAVEYGLLVALIAAVIIAVVGFLGQDILEAFNTIEDRLGGNDGT
jgi:pilus assembly protein Flp/PilA